jgi:uncharacterized protein YeeX (DUF496 family)
MCLLLLPAGLSAQEEKFKTVVREVRKDLEKAQEEKVLTATEIEQQRTELKRHLNQLKDANQRGKGNP